MNWIVDVVIIIILALSAFAGWRKGAIKSVIGLVFLIANICLSIWLSKYLADFLMSTSFGNIVKNWVSGWFGGSNAELFNSVITKTETDIFVTYQGVQIPFATALEYAKFPSFLIPIVTSAVSAIAVNGLTLSEILVPSLASFLMIIFSIFILLIIFAIVFGIIKSFLRKLFASDGLRAVDKLLGLFCGLIKGILFVLIIFLILNMFSNIPILASVFNVIEASYIGGFVIKTNLLQMMLTLFANLQQYFTNLFGTMFMPAAL